MNMNVTYKSTLFVLTIGIAILLFLQIKSCEPKYESPIYSQDYVDSLKFESELLSDEVFMLHNDIAVLDSILYYKKDNVIKGRDVIRILEKNVIIHDTVIITYVEALNWQIKELDTIVDIQEKKIDKQAQIIDKQDTVIKNINKIVAIQEKEIEVLQDDNKKKDRKIKLLKIERLVYPIGAIISIFTIQNI